PHTRLTLSLHSLFSSFFTPRRPPRPTLFPTRRSSDLAHEHATRPGRSRTPRPHPHRRHHRRRRLQPRQLRRHPAAQYPPTHRLRSEEHTSELQSRFDLVCRLLLEKKKQQN